MERYVVYRYVLENSTWAEANKHDFRLGEGEEIAEFSWECDADKFVDNYKFGVGLGAGDYEVLEVYQDLGDDYLDFTGKQEIQVKQLDYNCWLSQREIDKAGRRKSYDIPAREVAPKESGIYWVHVNPFWEDKELKVKFYDKHANVIHKSTEKFTEATFNYKDITDALSQIAEALKED